MKKPAKKRRRTPDQVANRRRSTVKKLLEADPDLVIEAVLSNYFWPKKLRPGVAYCRFDDDTRLGNIEVIFSQDSDAWISVFSNPDPNEGNMAHRFRIPFIGGGQSGHTRNALMILARAIAMDGEVCPQHREKKHE